LKQARGERHAALIIDPARAGAVLAFAAELGEWLRRQGWSPHLIALGDGRLSWLEEYQDIFSNIIGFQAPVLRPARAALAREAYLGTSLPALEPELVADAVGTLAGFDLGVCVQHCLAHSLMGSLRDLDVETWAVLGLADEARSPAEIVNACAA